MIRAANRERVLACLRDRGRASRADIHRATGLTKPTVSKIVDELLADRAVKETGIIGSSAAGGRPSSCLELDPTCAAYVGLELDTDRTRIAVADYTGILRDVSDGPPPGQDPEQSAAGLAKLVRKALRNHGIAMTKLVAAGVSVPSLVDPDTGHCFLAPNLGWREFPLADEISRRLGAPVHVANVPQAAALAESRWGVARGAQRFVWVYLGSGVGAGIINNGEVFLGQRGLSGEFGHCRIVQDGLRCGCGGTGCLETVASVQAMLNRWEALRHRDRQRKNKHGTVSLADWQRALEEADPEAQASLRSGARYLGQGLSFLINVLDPELVVLGGQAGGLGKRYLKEVRASALEHTLAPERVNLKTSTLGGNAALWGALLLSAPRSSDPAMDIHADQLSAS